MQSSPLAVFVKAMQGGRESAMHRFLKGDRQSEAKHCFLGEEIPMTMTWGWGYVKQLGRKHRCPPGGNLGAFICFRFHVLSPPPSPHKSPQSNHHPFLGVGVSSREYLIIHVPPPGTGSLSYPSDETVRPAHPTHTHRRHPVLSKRPFKLLLASSFLHSC